MAAKWFNSLGTNSNDQALLFKKEKIKVIPRICLPWWAEQTGRQCSGALALGAELASEAVPVRITTEPVNMKKWRSGAASIELLQRPGLLLSLSLGACKELELRSVSQAISIHACFADCS